MSNLKIVFNFFPLLKSMLGENEKYTTIYFKKSLDKLEIFNMSKEIPNEPYISFNVYEDGRIFDVNKNKFMKPYYNTFKGDRNSYLFVKKYMNKRSNKLYIHRLVASVYLEKENDKQTEVDHIDRDRTNNRVDNLRWVTRKENMKNIIKPKRQLKTFIIKIVLYLSSIYDNDNNSNGVQKLYNEAKKLNFNKSELHYYIKKIINTGLDKIYKDLDIVSNELIKKLLNLTDEFLKDYSP